MNFLIAVVIGLVIGGVGGYLLRSRHSAALWLTPALAVAGAVVASILATLFGDPGYGWKEATLQVVLALVGVGAVFAIASRSPATPSSPESTGSTAA